ncbi:MAG: DUF4184 family protein [Verrucomicrobiota bacterium]
MPFTIAHAGFVVPLTRVLSPTIVCGLMIGSMVPDFPYFVRAFGLASFAHTLPGAFCVSFPLGLIVFLVVRLCFERISEIFPKPHSSFVSSWDLCGALGRRGLPGVMIAIVLGALVHYFIDSLTHPSGFAVSMIPMLRAEPFSLSGEQLPVYRLLQYFGSALGLAMLVVAYGLGFRRHCHVTDSGPWQDSRRWLFLLFLIGATVVFAAVLNVEFIPREFDFYRWRVFGFQFLITWLPAMGGAFLCAAATGTSKPENERSDEVDRPSS